MSRSPRWSRASCAGASSRPRSSTRSSSTGGTSPSAPAGRSTSSTPPGPTSTPSSPTGRSRTLSRPTSEAPGSGSGQLGLAEPALGHAGRVRTGGAQGVAVLDEGAVGPVDGRARARDDGHGTGIPGGGRGGSGGSGRAAGGDVGEDQQGVGQPPGGLLLVGGQPGEPGAEVEEPAAEGQAESEQATGDQVGHLVVLVRRVGRAVPAQDDDDQAEREQHGPGDEEHDLERAVAVVADRGGTTGGRDLPRA